MEDLVDEESGVIIDFTGLDGTEEKLQEILGPSIYTMGSDIKTVLGRMFGMNSVPVTIKGSDSQIDAFAKVLGSEKRYIETSRNLGDSDPRTKMSHAQVKAAANEFKRKTGIEWPFK